MSRIRVSRFASSIKNQNHRKAIKCKHQTIGNEIIYIDNCTFTKLGHLTWSNSKNCLGSTPKVLAKRKTNDTLQPISPRSILPICDNARSVE